MIALALALAAAPACAPGVYLNGREAAVPEIVVEKRKLGNLAGAVFLSPFAAGKLKVKSVIPGPAALVRIAERRPTFRFCIAAETARDGDYVGVGAAPADYRLVRLVPAGDHRELELAAVGGLRGGGRSLAKSVVATDTETAADGSLLVRPRSDLPPGEYGFVRIAAAGMASTRRRDVNERVVDFAVVTP